jgi:hypothetical protein
VKVDVVRENMWRRAMAEGRLKKMEMAIEEDGRDGAREMAMRDGD